MATAQIYTHRWVDFWGAASASTTDTDHILMDDVFE
jgi:hypothetical protein